MRILKISRNTFIILLLLGSLALNGAIFAFEIAGTRFAAFWDAATMATEVATLGGANKNLMRANKKLAAKNGRLVVMTSTLQSENGKLKKSQTRLTTENKDLTARNAHLVSSLIARTSALAASKKKWETRKTKINKLTRSVTNRLIRLNLSNIGAMATEAIPIVGIGFIIAATTYEIAESCAVATEMTKIRDIIGTDEEGDEGIVCGMKVPNREELRAKIKRPDSGRLGDEADSPKTKTEIDETLEADTPEAETELPEAQDDGI